MARRSFFERITGSTREDGGILDDDAEQFEDEEYEPLDDESDFDYQDETERHGRRQRYESPNPVDRDDEVGELPVDVYFTDNAIFIKAMTAGVRKSDLDIIVNRDQVQISGSRQEKSSAPPENYQHRELYWGSFSRLIELPFEIDIEEASAMEDAGLLTLKLTKLNKNRTTRLRVE